MEFAEPEFGDQWIDGCPECGETESLIASSGIKGYHILLELECPYCGFGESAYDTKIADQNFEYIALLNGDVDMDSVDTLE